MRRKQPYRCRLCGKTNFGRLYCSDSHKSQYYHRLRDMNINKNPNRYVNQLIREELSKPVNDLYLKVERVDAFPDGRARRSVWKILLVKICKEMKYGEIRRVPVVNAGKVGYLKSLCSHLSLKMEVFGRKVDGKSYIYFIKEKEEPPNQT